MDNKLVVVLVLAVAVIAVGAGFILGGFGEDEPVEEDGPVTYKVSKYLDRPEPNGDMVITINFSDDPIIFTLHYRGVQLIDNGWQHGKYRVDPDTMRATPCFTMPYGVQTYEQLVKYLEVRSQYVDLVPQID